MTPVHFLPSTTSLFQFQAILDLSTYTVILTWALFGQRYYVNIYDVAANLVVSLPLISSPDNYDISMTAGYFYSTLVFRASTQSFEITP